MSSRIEWRERAKQKERYLPSAFRKQIDREKHDAILEHFEFFFPLARHNDANTLKSLLEAFDALITGSP